MNIMTPAQPGPLLELDLLRTLVAIADTGNFSAAADRLGRTPSAVSMQVKKMEELVGSSLFVRDSRSVSLTRDGEAVLQHGRRLLALNREMMARFVQPDLVGEVHLGAPDDVVERFLPAMLRHFAEDYPGILLSVMVDGTARLIESVERAELDLSIVTCEVGFATDGRAEIVHREPLVWACLAGGVAAEQRPLPVSMWEEGCLWRKSALEALDSSGWDYRVAFQSSNISGQRAAVLADLVIAPLARSHIGGQIVEAKPSLGLPALPECALGLMLRENASPTVLAAAAQVRACFGSHTAVTSPGS